ncbi:unnamed protein product [Blepharisma stoltei]|uniref:Glutamine-dependent NAD(+) synthetase n=1 Tax=Blepharisma stoltei TaxID=1481888 RepID=A0AAU9JAA0_9CILI|nr:unnamed protein product [Blepharisma stoltei]
MEPTIVSTCSLDQWALDFKGNEQRIIESIIQAKRMHNAKIRLGSQAEVTGYSIEDHYVEPDTIYHSWQVLLNVIKVTLIPPYNDILCLIGMPLYFHGVVYNCSVLIYNGKVILIKPKVVLADDGLNREKRWFTAWCGNRELMQYSLPAFITDVTGQQTAPFGNGMLRSEDGYLIGVETYEELLSPVSSSTELFLMGAHIVLNMGGNPFQMSIEFQKWYSMMSASVKTGGIYMYSNQIGCDGHRTYFNARSMIFLNGNCFATTEPFSMKSVDVVSAALDLSEVDSYRNAIASRNMQAKDKILEQFPVIVVPGFKLLVKNSIESSLPIQVPEYSRAEETGFAPACYLWDYLRRTNASGFFLPLSGGSDSASVLAIIAIMCRKVMHCLNVFKGYNLEVLQNDLRRIIGKIPENHHEMLHEIMHTAYLASENSSEESKARAKNLAEEIGSNHFEENIDEVYNEYLNMFTSLTNSNIPKYESKGGTKYEDVALQNLQARIRMVASYMAGQLLPWVLGKKGFLIILGSGNIEESLTGYMTKYDTSSADINPIGGVSKIDLRHFLLWASERYNYRSIIPILEATPTAELQPLSDWHTLQQTDEHELGLSYEEIHLMAMLRKIDHCGPLYMFNRCLTEWKTMEPELVAKKVKKFFTYYAVNRHKMVTLTPVIHMDSLGCDDNRYDLRPFLYNSKWEAQYNDIDKIVENIKNPQ